ncbi:MAG: hypothetical protein IJ631_03955 [Schwartzia sp.]|nr:hypothetical protein [Schwartzia sp. (in: firmicutes)]
MSLIFVKSSLVGAGFGFGLGFGFGFGVGGGIGIGGGVGAGGGIRPLLVFLPPMLNSIPPLSLAAQIVMKEVATSLLPLL